MGNPSLGEQSKERVNDLKAYRGISPLLNTTLVSIHKVCLHNSVSHLVNFRIIMSLQVLNREHSSNLLHNHGIWIRS